ncbi:hypothetical protein INT46_005149 [Mucor plumbeus]|uniref:Ras modification protein ERF4 n=1 Tax=Mucor plumbeus TaxID=97098 RepID=A0A8H7QKI1_9FUNG|nr:hypothetical protein INT46_005149 [Mucor plumbeus]
MYTLDEPTLPQPAHLKSRGSPSIISEQQSYKHIDTTALIDNTSSSSLDEVLEVASTRVSSTILAGSLTVKNTKEPHNNSNKDAMLKAHEIISIQSRVPVKSIRVERDYSLGDGITRFSTQYPVELEGKITTEQFLHTINEINNIMDYADRLSWRIVLENIIETLTIYLWPILFSTHYQRVVKRLLTFIESENSTIYYPQTLSISNPVKSAFLFIEINFYE